MINKKNNYKNLMIQILLIEIIAILIGFMFVMKPNAEMINSPETISYVSPQVGNPTFVRQLYYGNRWSGVSVGQSLALDYYVVDYSYRMTDTSRHYNVYFQVYGSMGQKGTITLNNQACQIYDNDRNNSATDSTINNAVFNVACIDISSDQNQFQLVLRYDTTWSPYADNLYMVKQGFFVSSYPTEQQALNNAMSDLANAINTNQTDNTNRVINSVNNMTNALNQQQQQTNQKLDDINNTLNDSSVDGFSVNYDNDTNVISGLITMPITLSRAYLNGLNSSCQPYNLGSLYGSSLILPCVNVSSWLGSSLFSIIDVLISGFLIYAIAKMFIRTFNKLTNLNNREVEGDLFND